MFIVYIFSPFLALLSSLKSFLSILSLILLGAFLYAWIDRVVHDVVNGRQKNRRSSSSWTWANSQGGSDSGGQRGATNNEIKGGRGRGGPKALAFSRFGGTLGGLTTWEGAGTGGTFAGSTRRTPMRREDMPSLHPAATKDVNKSVDELLGLVIRDHINKWFLKEIEKPSPIFSSSTNSTSISDDFPLSVEYSVRLVLTRILNRLSNVDLANLIMSKIVPMITTHLETIRLAQVMVAEGFHQPAGAGSAGAGGTATGNPGGLGGGGGQASASGGGIGKGLKSGFGFGNNASAGTATGLADLDLLKAYSAVLSSRTTAPTSLHPAIDFSSSSSRPLEMVHLRNQMEKLLKNVLPEVGEGRSTTLRTLVREVLSNVVVWKAVETISDPDFLNRILDEKAGDALREQEMIERVRKVLDAQSSSHQPPQPPSSNRPRSAPAIDDMTGKKASPSNPSTPSGSLFDFATGGSVTATASTSRVASGSHPSGSSASKQQESSTATDTKPHERDRDQQHRSHQDRKFDPISLDSSPKQFESFVRSIDRIKSLIEARRLRTDIARESRGTQDALDKVDKEKAEEGGNKGRGLKWEKDKDRVAYVEHVKRLNFAMRKLDGRVKDLGGEDSISQQPNRSASFPPVKSTLLSILRQPESVLYFMEFMERRRRLELAQFWVDVETLKDLNPLIAASSTSTEIDLPATDADVQSAADHLVAIWMKYFKTYASGGEKKLPVEKRNITEVEAFLKGERKKIDLAKAERAILEMQTDVLEGMERNDLSEFSKTDLYFKAIGNLALPTPEPSPPSPPSAPLGPMPQIPRTRSTSGRLPRSESSSGIEFLLGTKADARQGVDTPRSDSSFSEISRKGRGSVDSGKGRGSETHLDFLMGASVAEGRPSLFDLEDSPQGPTARRSRTDNSITDSNQTTTEALRDALSSILEGAANSSTGTGGGNKSPSTSFMSPRQGTVFDDAEPLSENEDDMDRDGGNSLSDSTSIYHGPSPSEIDSKIEELKNQESVLRRLIDEAELMGQYKQLRVLNKSRDSLLAEIEALTLRKEFYAGGGDGAAADLNSDATVIKISGTTVGQSGGQQFVLYMVEVYPLGVDNPGWIVTRRFSQFWELHQTIVSKLPSQARSIEGLPPKSLLPSSPAQVEQRRLALEKYLTGLVRNPAICTASMELKRFLSTSGQKPRQHGEVPLPTSLGGESGAKDQHFLGQGVLRGVVKAFTVGMGTILSGPTVLDVIVQQLAQQAADFSGMAAFRPMSSDDLLGGGPTGAGAASPTTTEQRFAAPVCDLFIEVFGLGEKQNWLRKQAIIILLQQILGGTIERRFREVLKVSLDSEHIVNYLKITQGILWPKGVFIQTPPARSDAQKTATKEAAKKKLNTVVPDLAAHMIGRGNARRGARRMFDLIQNQRLNKLLIYTLMDEVLALLIND